MAQNQTLIERSKHFFFPNQPAFIWAPLLSLFFFLILWGTILTNPSHSHSPIHTCSIITHIWQIWDHWQQSDSIIREQIKKKRKREKKKRKKIKKKKPALEKPSMWGFIKRLSYQSYIGQSETSYLCPLWREASSRKAPTWLDRILSQTSMHLCSNFIPTVHHIELIYHKKWLSMHAKFFLSKW